MGIVLNEIFEKKYAFAAKKELNDLWIEIDLDSPEQENGIIYVIQALLGLHYEPLRNAELRIHCKI
jgi:hypothetical protein